MWSGIESNMVAYTNDTALYAVNLITQYHYCDSDYHQSKYCKEFSFGVTRRVQS